MRKNKQVFIIAEAGSNWRLGTAKRDLLMAKKLIDIAKEADADAIKFQTYKPESVYVPNAGKSDYLSEAGIDESITEIFEDLSMPYEMIPKLSKYCISKEIEFMSTPFSIDDAKAIDPYTNIHKLASYEITHIRLLEFLAKTGKPLIISTGAATIEEIEWAKEIFFKNKGTELILMQTTAKYPAPFDSLNLKTIPNMIKKFNLNVGLSDHSREPLVAPITAVSLGAKFIEKHFTIDNRLPGPDHSFAITPDELKIMVNGIRNCEKSLGDGIKKIHHVEEELREYAQRGIQAIKNIKKNENFVEDKNIAILRSGKQKRGIHPKYLSKIEGKKSNRDIFIGDGIQNEDIVKN
jgi:sialic acid synthase SpsE|tara:strand:- start:17400 stop:18449 length:1050 start_codon:yes stop_codon:yes gene_type:complete